MSRHLRPRGNGVRSVKKFFGRLLRDRRAAVGLEMAIVAPPFLLLMLTVLDFALLLAMQSLLDGACRDAARQIRTGQLQVQSSPITSFQNIVCADMNPLMTTATCQAKVVFDVQTFGTWSSVAFTPCTQNANSSGNGTPCSFTPGNSGGIVGIQTTYNRPFIVPWVGSCLSGGNCWTGIGTTSGSISGTGTAPLISTVIFRNEPF